jgi:hypothetical protein
MEEEEIPLKEFSSKFRDKEEDEDKSCEEDGDLEKEEGETASRDWGEMSSCDVDEDQEDSLKEVITIPSKSVCKVDEQVKLGQKGTATNEDWKKVKVGNIVLDSLEKLKKKKKATTQDCDMPSDSSDVSLQEVCTIPNFKVEEEKWATAEEESEDEEKAEESVEGYSGGNKKKDLKSKAFSHEFDMSGSSEVSLNDARTIPPSFIDEEKETAEVKAEEEMTERVQQMSFSQDLGSSSDSSEISLEEIPSNFIDEDEEESQRDAFPNQNLETIEEEDISDEESGEENVIRFPHEEEIEAMDEIPLDDNEAEGGEPINEEREPRLSFSAVVRLILAVQRLRKKTKTNSFASTVQILHVTLNLGYYFLVVPFKIVLDQNGKFKIHVNPWQMVCPPLLWFIYCNYYNSFIFRRLLSPCCFWSFFVKLL